jgi:hypothetical protein
MNTDPNKGRHFPNGATILRIDLEFPAGALIVDGYDADGNLLAHPKGGGLQFQIPPSEHARFDIVADAETTPIFTRGLFSVEGVDEVFEGWTDGHRWNGWAMPFFEREQAEWVMRCLSPSGHFDTARDCFITTTSPDEPEEWQGVTISLPDGGSALVYPIGAGSWIWDDEA